MKKRRVLIALMFGMLFTFFGCQGKPSKSLNLKIPSLKENYSVLINKGKEWDEDAYLVLVSMPFGANDMQIFAFFDSPTKQYESLMLVMSSDKSFKIKTFEKKASTQDEKPILESDWKIDSVDALEKFVSSNEDAIQFLLSHPNHCSDLQLERFSPTQDQPVVWSLSLFDCHSETKYFYMDPKTGEMLLLTRTLEP